MSSSRSDIFTRGAILAAMALLASAWSEPAAAKIQCKDNLQVTTQGLIATPYCEGEKIARVARSCGWRGTVSQVHNNPNTRPIYSMPAVWRR